jgi:GNAT superfamily N-acetyltransferase
MSIITRELKPNLWSDVEDLFGANGACGGCWCMTWRLQKGEKWGEVKGAVNRKRFERGVREGTIYGILAYVDGSPVGWCNFGPRVEFLKLDRSASLRCDDADQVWSIPCFFVRRGFRGIGVAGAMLAHALRSMAERGVRIVEGYPAGPGKDGKYIDAFSWTGTLSLFLKAGFEPADNKTVGMRRVRKYLA